MLSDFLYCNFLCDILQIINFLFEQKFYFFCFFIIPTKFAGMTHLLGWHLSEYHYFLLTSGIELICCLLYDLIFFASSIYLLDHYAWHVPCLSYFSIFWLGIPLNESIGKNVCQLTNEGTLRFLLLLNVFLMCFKFQFYPHFLKFLLMAKFLIVSFQLVSRVVL